MSIRIVLIDDDPFVCASLTTILSAEDDLEIVSSGHSGAEALELVEKNAPDIVLMDIQMPGMSGLEAAERILGEPDAPRVVFLTTFSDEEYIVRALRIGSSGYLIKQDVAAIAPSLRSVMAGQSVLGKEIVGRVDRLMSCQQEADADLSGSGLTTREADIVELIAHGLSNDEIADRLDISSGTVRNRISEILTRLDLKNRTQIAVWYYTRG